MYTTKQKNGLLSESLTMTKLLEKNIPFAIPFGSFDEYDLIADTPKGLKRIQIKTCYFDNSSNRYVVSLVTSHRRSNQISNKKYSSNSFDYLIGVCKELSVFYIMPIEIILNRRQITLYPEGIPESTLKANKNAGYNYEKFKENWEILL